MRPHRSHTATVAAAQTADTAGKNAGFRIAPNAPARTPSASFRSRRYRREVPIYLVSEAWWDGIILYIFRLTDNNKKVLSLVTLKKLLPSAIQGTYDQELKHALAASRFAHDLRHADIGHRNREVALRVKPVPRSSRDQVRKAIAAVDHALHFVDHHYTGNEPTIYDHLEIRGGSGAILWMVQRGLAASDGDFKNHRPPMRFAD